MNSKSKPNYHTYVAVINHFVEFDIDRLTQPACSSRQLCSWRSIGKYRQKTLPLLKTCVRQNVWLLISVIITGHQSTDDNEQKNNRIGLLWHFFSKNGKQLCLPPMVVNNYWHKIDFLTCCSVRINKLNWTNVFQFRRNWKIAGVNVQSFNVPK